MPDKIDDSTKLYIEEKLKNTRHDLSNNFQNAIFWVDSKLDAMKERQSTYEATQKLQNQVNDSIKQDLKMANEWIHKLIEKIENLDKKFITREEGKQMLKEIENTNKQKIWVVYLILSIVIWALIKNIII